MPIRSWGDVNVALNALIREEVIVSFRTNRESNADPAIGIVPAGEIEPAVALRLARAMLSGAFQDANVTLAD